jgi:hypothetical protein
VTLATGTDFLDQEARAASSGSRYGHHWKPLSYGLVIGLGGAGIQTISRIRSSVQGGRPDAAAVDAVRFLGIDAVRIADQHPPIPPDYHLKPQEFVNLTQLGFDPHESLRTRGHGGGVPWWDPAYLPPRGDQTQGLRRSRMLGHLAWTEARELVGDAIYQAISDAVQLDPSFTERGQAGQGDAYRLKIFVVGSAVGGTGSSGFLEVINQIWQRCPAHIVPEIRAFLYLPGVFYGALEGSADRETERRAHRSNAFAFFRELDHFVRHTSELPRVLDPTGLHEPRDLIDGDLLEQVFLVDNVIQGVGQLGRVTDAYAAVAETIYHLLMTDLGRPLAGAGAVNATVLRSVDQFGKRRIYSGLGVARVVYPAVTYERHVRYLFADTLLRSGLLWNDPVAIAQLVHEDPNLEGFLASLDEVLLSPPGAGQAEVSQYRGIAGDAAETLSETPTVAEAARLRRTVERREADAVQALADHAGIRNAQALRDLPEQLERAVISAGRGVPYGRLMLKRVLTLLHTRLESAVDGQRQAQAQIESIEERWQAQRRALQDATERRLARFRGGRPGELAKGLGQLLDTRANAVVSSHTHGAAAGLLRALIEAVEHLDQQLDRATWELQERAARAERAWRDDRLQGKDDGARATTALIPADVSPEVEESALSQQVAAAIRAEVTDRLLGSDAIIGEVLSTWYSEAGGPFALGDHVDPDRKLRAEESLHRQLFRVGEAHALRTTEGEPRLPQSLRTAASAEPEALDAGLRSIVSLSRSVWIAWEPARIRPVEGGTPPSIATTIAVPSDLAHAVKDIVGDAVPVRESPDPDIVLALSYLWGLPFHAIAEVRTWQGAYEQVLRSRRRDPAADYPPHIDHRFETNAISLEPLLPRYYAEGDAIRHTALALLVARLVRVTDRAELAPMFLSLRDFEAVPAPIRGEVVRGQTVYVSTSLRHNGSTWERANDRRVGALVALIEHMGTDLRDQSAVTGYLEELERRLGSEIVRDQALSLAAALTDRLAELEGEDRDAVHDLAAALREYGTTITISLVDL